MMLFWVGAGLSRASGVPQPPAYDRARFLLHQDQCWQDYAGWREQVLRCQPNRGHQLLHELQQARPGTRIVTLNQDGLLQRAGCEVLELHGNAFGERGTPRRPDVIWSGEDLNPARLEQVFGWIGECHTLVMLGTSSRLQPSCEFPLRARGRARLIEINPEETPLSSQCDECWRGPAEELLGRFLTE